MLPDDTLNQDTPEERIAALVDAVKQDPRHRDLLVALLPERISLYAGRSTNATTRMRGYIIAAFEQVGLPEVALPYVLDELENGRDAYLVAAAARALRGLDAPATYVVPFLLKAIENIKCADDAVSFENYLPQWPIPSYTTAIEEIMKTCAWLGADARCALPVLQALCEDREAVSATARATLEAVLAGLSDADACCRAVDVDACCSAAEEHSGCRAVPIGPDMTAKSSLLTHTAASPGSVFAVDFGFTAGRARADGRTGAVPTGVEMEDQDGYTLTFGDFFSRRPSIVVFFYTRCNNPNKCSLTITKLAGLQRALRDEGLQRQFQTAAITYDPDFDLPSRLIAYGKNRGVLFGDNDRFLRTKAGLEALQEYFELGVNFGQALVNRHRIELFILDHEGRIAVTFTRLQWDIQDVLHHARTLLSPSRGHP